MPPKRIERSKWYLADKRTPIISIRIVGLNLQGKPQKSMLFFAKELQVTVFVLELTIGSYRWTVSRSFDELKDFYTLLTVDRELVRGRDLLKAPFPSGKDGETDVMILVERREMIEYFLKEVINNLDFELYQPLNVFIDAYSHMEVILKKLKIMIRFLRSIIAKKKLYSRLYRFYSKELLSFIYLMENGIEVYNIDGISSRDVNQPPEVSVLWLDVCEEPGLSRICLAPKPIFQLPKHYEDERLANGIFLSDIAEVRRGASSSIFRQYSSCAWVNTKLSFSIIASERSLAVQLLQPLTPTIATSNSSFSFDRFLLIDMLNLLSLQSLSSNEVKTRQRKFYRVCPHESVRFPRYHLPIKSQLAKKRQEDCEKMMKLLINGIDVDEENFSPYFGMRIVQRHLRYDPVKRVLWITCLNNNTNDGAQEGVEGTKVEESMLLPMITGPLTPEIRRQETLDVEDVEVQANELEEDDDEDEEDEEENEVNFGLPSNFSKDLNQVPEDEEDTSNSSRSSLASSVLHPELIPGEHSEAMSGTSPSNAPMLNSQYFLPSMLPGEDLISQDRCIDLDDISEIRPGKVSSSVDGSEDLLYVTVVSSQSILVLPVHSLTIRNNLVRRFQAFLCVNRNYEVFEQDQSSLFYTRNVSLPPRNTSSRPTTPLPQRINSLEPILTTSSTPPNTTSSTSPTSYQTPGTIPTTTMNKKKLKGKSTHLKKGKKNNALDYPISLTPNLNNTNNNNAMVMKQCIYSHVKPVRSVSVIRRSSTSSRGMGASSITGDSLSMSLTSLSMEMDFND